MNNMKKSARRVFWLLALCFFLLLGYLGKLALVDREEISANSYNIRMRTDVDGIQRGDILDKNGEVLATSVQQEDGSYLREYNRARMAAHITGYSSVGKTGVEAAANFELMTPYRELLQRIQGLLSGTDPRGNDVVLAVDMDIQSIAGDLLGSAKGAVVVMEPSTGRVLAMQAYPDFDPNTVSADWEYLVSDEDSPLVNRATQGLYPPGSTFKTITALAAMEYFPDWQNFTYTCTGEEEFQDKVIHCYNNRAHGTVDMAGAMAASCNCYFAALAEEIGADNLSKEMEACGITADYGFDLAYSNSIMHLNADSTESELVETAIGQGKTSVSPLYMAMLISAIANDGIMMEPYIIDHMQYYNGETGKTTVPNKLMSICTPEEAAALKEMLIGVVESGTGTAAQISGVTVAGKTGTAENATGKDHSWFVGYAPAEDPQVSIAVIIENSEAYGSATPIAGKVLKAALEKMAE
ncbi:penicillin-binding protein 2 [Anaerotignum lactatifermentans]|nr:penicillin-binding transpeptidase domain-containing protein [Anaerotignum lactatifermentans]MBM6828206.1 penicillin-binding protein 2 [Anaerotignum lactatifermentans]MBM6949789.1 penicillin-binding protein 2 [Anaerotignum lactatifermentans]